MDAGGGNRAGRAFAAALVFFTTMFAAAQLTAATVILKNGATLKGTLLSRTADETSIQDPVTKKPVVLKNALIRDLVLDADEKKQAESKDKDLKLMSGEEARQGHVLLALGGSGCKIIGGPGASLNIAGGGATLVLQYNYIARGFGIDLHGSFYYYPDKKYSSDYIMITPVLLSPMYKFNVKSIDIDLRAGAGISYTRGKSAQRFKPIPTGDPGSPLSAQLIKGINASTIDLAVGGGIGLSHVFKNSMVLGFELNYVYIFQTLSANTVTTSLYVGYLF